MITFLRVVFMLSQIYISLASVFFVTGHVLKDPMQNGLYLIYALTLPIVSVVFFYFMLLHSNDKKGSYIGNLQRNKFHSTFHIVFI